MKKEKEAKQANKHSIEPGHPDYKPDNTGVPDVEVMDEDVKAEQVHEKKLPNQETGDEEKKIVNEQEQNQVVNDDEDVDKNSSKPKETPKMNDKPKEAVNPQER
jgi:hypothetical protein